MSRSMRRGGIDRPLLEAVVYRVRAALLREGRSSAVTLEGAVARVCVDPCVGDDRPRLYGPASAICCAVNWRFIIEPDRRIRAECSALAILFREQQTEDAVQVLLRRVDAGPAGIESVEREYI